MVIVALLVLLVIGVVVSLLASTSPAHRDQRRAKHLRSQVRQTDAAIGRDHQRAKRAMNDAAGQSWRNRFE
ncbi:hypothetical protein [Nostocoides vanveenii]|uniref:Uncharacterized protein n=1 Tax=Nostocoides vanveenii TaxID=330835 RepID=A0ABN2KMC9_9MICO